MRAAAASLHTPRAAATRAAGAAAAARRGMSSNATSNVVPKIVGGALRHPGVVAGAGAGSEAHSTCATVLYRHQRAALLQEKARSSHTPTPNAMTTPSPQLPSHTPPMAPIAVAAAAIPVSHSRSAADIYREKRQALRDAGVPLATAAAALSAGTHPSGSSTNPSTTAGAAALLLGGGGAAAAAAVAWYGGLVGAGVGGEEAAVAGVAAAAGPSSAAAVGPAADAASLAQQPIWLQRPRGS